MNDWRNDDPEYAIASWFPDTLSDEAAVAMHLFLEQFTYQFEGHYYDKIRRYYQQQQGEERVQEEDDHQLEMPWGDKIPF